MLKRTTKVTSLLIVAASIVSIIPAMAADVKKVAGEEGTVYGAKSNADGTFYIDAELNGADEAIYSYKDGKYTKVNGADAGDTIGDVVSYDGKNYLQMNDGSYYVDLKTGETKDDDIIANIDDDAATALRKNIKADNDGRFDETLAKDLHTADDKVRNIGDGAGNIVAGQKTMFGITGKWRQYFYELKTSDLDGKAKSTVYSDDKGNYIDVDYNLGKVGVVSTTYGAVTIENTKDTYESTVNGTTYEMKATIANDVTWDEGPVYITRTAHLKIWGRVKTSNDSKPYADITNKVSFGSKNNKHVAPTFNGDGSVTVLQRISKAQASDDVDGIKYAKDVKTYFITDADGKAQPLLGLGDITNASGATPHAGYGLITGQTDGYLVGCYKDMAKHHQYTETINLKQENGYYYTDVDDVDDVTAASNDAMVIGCGDVYALSDDGYVEKFNGKDSSFEKLYKVDGGMDKISASLPIFSVVWSKDDENYSIITPGAPAGDKKDTTAATDATKTTGVTTTVGTTTATKAGWAKATDGTWSFVKADGTKATAWLQDGTTWYYLNASGVMQTGWINDNGTWYYCNGSGAMLANTTVNGYVLGASGAWVK